MKKTKIALIVVVMVLLVLAGFFLKTAITTGEFKQLSPHGPGDCRVVGGVLGSEDITIHAPTGMAFISSCDFRRLTHGDPGPSGAVFLYDLKADAPELVEATKDLPFDFYPHGLGLYTDADGRVSLLVINHRPDGSYVEIFDYMEKNLIHRRSVTGPLMISPNDLCPVGPARFYFTNDHGSGSKTGKTVEDYLQLSRANVVFYDGRDFRIVAEGMSYANGINISPDGRKLYVGETIGRKLNVFRRDTTSGDLTLEKSVDLKTGLDNIEVDPDGRLWIGAHPKLLTFVRHSQDPARRSPSQILKVTVGSDQSLAVDEVYLSLGQPLSGSSVGAAYMDKLLIGSVFDDRFLICGLK